MRNGLGKMRRTKSGVWGIRELMVDKMKRKPKKVKANEGRESLTGGKKVRLFLFVSVCFRRFSKKLPAVDRAPKNLGPRLWEGILNGRRGKLNFGGENHRERSNKIHVLNTHFYANLILRDLKVDDLVCLIHLLIYMLPISRKIQR